MAGLSRFDHSGVLDKVRKPSPTQVQGFLLALARAAESAEEWQETVNRMGLHEEAAGFIEELKEVAGR
jgi:hypothetical protein